MVIYEYKADYLTVSFDNQNMGGFVRDAYDVEMGVKGDFERFISQVGVLQVKPGLYKYDFGTKPSGSMRLYKRGRVLVLSVSGGMLDRFRSFGYFEAFLSFIGSHPHRVTSIDIAADSMVYAPPILQELAARAGAGMLQLTRKRLTNHQCHFISQPNDKGDATGTLMLGKRGKHEVHCKIYDKQWERICFNAENKTTLDIGPERIRYEITISGKYAITLRDAADPAALFHHFMGRSVLESPPHIPPWVGHAEGFTMSDIIPITSVEALGRRVDYSAEVESLWRLSSELGASGESLLFKLLRERFRTLDSEHEVELSRIELSPAAPAADDTNVVAFPKGSSFTYSPVIGAYGHKPRSDGAT